MRSKSGRSNRMSASRGRRPSDRNRYMLASMAARSGSTLAPEIESTSFPFFHKLCGDGWESEGARGRGGRGQEGDGGGAGRGVGVVEVGRGRRGYTRSKPDRQQQVHLLNFEVRRTGRLGAP